MVAPRETPFDNVESAHEYIRLLAEAILEAKTEIESDIKAASGQDRRVEALRLVEYKLDKLEQHLHNSTRLLNDLRTLRRLLLDERQKAASGVKAK